MINLRYFFAVFRVLHSLVVLPTTQRAKGLLKVWLLTVQKNENLANRGLELTRGLRWLNPPSWLVQPPQPNSQTPAFFFLMLFVKCYRVDYNGVIPLNRTCLVFFLRRGVDPKVEKNWFAPPPCRDEVTWRVNGYNSLTPHCPSYIWNILTVSKRTFETDFG